MRKYRSVIWLFALLVAIMGWWQWHNEHRDPTFKTRLLDFNPQSVQKISITAPGQPAFQLLKVDPHWLLSYDNVNVRANALPVGELLNTLKDIRTQLIIATEQSAWDNYGLDRTQASTICLQYTSKEQEDCLHIGRFVYEKSLQTLQAFGRLNEQPEVLSLDGFPLSKLQTNPRAFRRNVLWTINDPIENIEWENHDTTLRVSKTDSSWVSETAALATFNWTGYLQQLRYLSGTDFADDVDEISTQEQWKWILRLSSNATTYELYCYQDSTTQYPYIFHTRLRPEQWLASDSSGIYRILSSPWLEVL